MQTISQAELKSWLDSNKDFAFINVLPAESYEKEHIPGSVNIPLGSDEFEDKVEQTALGRNKPVVVYCASTECDASSKAAGKLDEAGFGNVFDYEGGTKDWKESGNKIESGQAVRSGGAGGS